MSTLVLGVDPAGATTIESRFNTGTEGWTVIGDGDGPIFSSTGGNPGGYIRIEDQGLSATYFFGSPASWDGNRSAYSGGTISYDLRLNGNTGYYNDRDLRIDNGSSNIWIDMPTNPGTSWTTYTATLSTASPWNFGGSFASPVRATQSQIDSVLANITQIWIRGEFRAGFDIGHLDNVVMTSPAAVPEINTAIAVTALVGAQLRRHRRQLAL